MFIWNSKPACLRRSILRLDRFEGATCFRIFTATFDTVTLINSFIGSAANFLSPARPASTLRYDLPSVLHILWFSYSLPQWPTECQTTQLSLIFLKSSGNTKGILLKSTCPIPPTGRSLESEIDQFLTAEFVQKWLKSIIYSKINSPNLAPTVSLKARHGCRHLWGPVEWHSWSGAPFIYMHQTWPTAMHSAPQRLFTHYEEKQCLHASPPQ